MNPVFCKRPRQRTGCDCFTALFVLLEQQSFVVAPPYVSDVTAVCRAGCPEQLVLATQKSDAKKR